MIYLDNNATTKIAPEVWSAMEPYFKDCYFNPSAGYAGAKKVRDAIEEARSLVAQLLGCHSNDIIFTSGGTEACNMALREIQSRGGSLALLATDHDATRTTAKKLTTPTICTVDSQGLINEAEWITLCHAPETAGVSFAWANNETGVIQNAKKLCAFAHETGKLAHVDMIQCIGKMPVNVYEIDADYASISAHKFHGPKGIGCLYRKPGNSITPLLYGGGQEYGFRSGTENVPGIIGMGAAAQLLLNHQEKHIKHLTKLQHDFEDFLIHQVGKVHIHSAQAPRIPNTTNVAFEGCTAEALMLLMEPKGLLCAAGSACHTIQPEPSHVLKAMGINDTEIRSSLRFSFSSYTTNDELQEICKIISETVIKVRQVQSTKTGPVIVYKP